MEETRNKTADNNRPRRLIIRMSNRGMAFSTVGAGDEVEYVTYTMNNSISVAANLREALQTEDILSRNYSSVLLMVDTPTAVIPLEFFNENQEELIFRHTYGSSNMATVMHYILPELNSVALFAIGKDLKTVITDHFKTVRFMPVVAPVWNHAHHRSYIGPKEKLYCYFHLHTMEVFAFRQNRFRFCNSFTVNNADDALYYLLSAWKQLAMAHEHDELHLCGEQTWGIELKEKAGQFLKRVYVINPIGEYNRAPVTQISGMPYDLMTLYVRGEK
jgi:hypothetical protein